MNILKTLCLSILIVFLTLGCGGGSSDDNDPDNDGDGIVNAEDNCPDAANADQADSDGDGIGDVCDSGGSKSWGMAELIETNLGNAGDAQISFDSNGNAIAVWAQSDGVRNNILANRYTAISGWNSVELIETDNSGDASFPQISSDADGNAIAVWSQNDGITNNIWANRYMVNVGWGTAELIETEDAGGAFDPHVASDPDGNAIAVWNQRDSSTSNIWANRYTVSSGWGTAELIETDNAGDANLAQVAVDLNGNAIAVWRQNDGIRNNIMANRFAAGSGWGTAELIETDNSGNASYPQIAFDSNGNAIAVWDQYDGSNLNILANRYTTGTGWGTAVQIENASSSASEPHISVDSDGNAIAVWQQHNGSGWNIWANRYSLGSGWGLPELIEEDHSDISSQTRVALGNNGHALAVWSRRGDTGSTVWANYYTISSGWSIAEIIQTGSGGGGWPQIAFDTSGNAIAVWSQNNGTRTDIWANRFD